MNLVRRAVFGLVVLVFAAPVFAGQAMQMWRCELGAGATEEQVTGMAAQWLAAAKKLDGGENLDVYVYFPVAVNSTGQMDLMFVVVAPSFAEWGRFWDAYPDSAVAEVENYDIAICPDSVVWEVNKVE